MRQRHRMPVLFTLSMMDVFCCALGCVILLWLLGMRQTREKAQDLIRSAQELRQTQESLSGSTTEAEALRGQLADATGELGATRAALEKQAMQLASALSRNAEQARDLKAALAVVDKLKLDLAGKDEEIRGAAERLSGLVKTVEDLTKQLAATRDSATALGNALKDKEGELAAAMKKAQDTTGRLTVVQKTADTVPELQAQVKEMVAQKSAAEARSSELAKQLAEKQKDLADSQRSLVDLQGAKRALAEEIDRVRAAADNRFAGIELTGRKVIFLVDMSGSMDLVDPNTPDVNKWLGVRQTLAKIMGSLPDLEAFQVIVFSTEAGFLFSDGGADWIRYDKAKSAATVLESLAKVQPRGNTNMYAAMEAAFRFRDKGLDTIYLLSDGLPNMGVGVPEETARQMRDTGHEPELSAQLSQVIRAKLKSAWNPPKAARRVRINSVGFFYESPDVGAFLWALSRENDGSFVGMSKP